MFGEPWPYWAAFAICALAWLAVPLAAWHERRQDERDRRIWERIRRGL